LSADPNFGFVVAAYIIGFVVLGGMILSVVTDYVSLKRALSKFPARSDTRGSD
jgi:heme exporter protein D